MIARVFQAVLCLLTLTLLPCPAQERSQPIKKPNTSPNSSPQSPREASTFNPIESTKQQAVNSLRMLAEAYTRERRFEEAIKPLKWVIDLKPDYAEAHNDLGWVYSELEMLDEAIFSFEQALSWKSDYISAYHNLGWAYHKRGNHQQAIESYQKILQLDPNYYKAASVHTEIAGCYAAMGKIPEAISSFNEAMKLHPNDPMVLNNYGYFLVERGENMNIAVEMLLKAIAKEPNDGHTLDSLGWAYFKLGNLDEAERYLREAVKYNSKSPTIQEHLGDLNQRRGNIDQAKKTWELALSLAAQKEQKERLRGKLK